MKRSEIVDFIEEYFWCDGVFFYSLPEHSEVKHDERSLKELAEKVVELVEMKGMRPPTYTGLMRDPGVKFIREEHVSADVMYVHGWEREEEPQVMPDGAI